MVSVGGPASSPYITSAGGTTIPTTLHYMLSGQQYEIDIPVERAWGWDYLQGLCGQLNLSAYDCGIWGVGGGGGVSLVFPVPKYQARVAGMDVTAAGQQLLEIDVPDPKPIPMPAGFAGRNVPDVSLNADPNTGFVLPFTDQYGVYSVSAFNGGTSFVAPQLNGIAALLQQKVGGRIGLLNFPLYRMARKDSEWGQSNSPFTDIAAGANWYWEATPGYDRSTGLGTLDVANLAEALVNLQAR
jgi:subtilase family serine protease